MDPSTIKKLAHPVINMTINNYYKLLIYLSSTILGFSFFFEVKNFDVALLRWITFAVLVISLLVWLAEAVLQAYNRYLYEKHITTRTMKKYYEKIWYIFCGFVAAQVIVWIAAFWIIMRAI